MNRQTALSNALACFHYLLSMYPDSIVCFSQWSYDYEVNLHVNLERFETDSIVKVLNNMLLADSSLEVNANLRPDTDVIHLHFPWGV